MRRVLLPVVVCAIVSVVGYDTAVAADAPERRSGASQHLLDVRLQPPSIGDLRRANRVSSGAASASLSEAFGVTVVPRLSVDDTGLPSTHLQTVPSGYLPTFRWRPGGRFSRWRASGRSPSERPVVELFYCGTRLGVDVRWF